MFVKSIENFLEDFEKSFSPKNVVLSEYSNMILSFISYSFFGLKIFSKALTKFPIDFTNMFNVFERPA